MKSSILVASIALVATLSSFTLAQIDDGIVRAYKTSKPPTLDGKIDPGEWDAAGPAYVIAPDGDIGTAFPADPYGGPDDVSFQFRVMWAEPWTAYFLFEVTDDIAMEVAPANLWEQDQVEFFMDGDNLEGSTELETFQWWDNVENYGKFGGSRWPGQFEGNGGVMSEFLEDIYTDGFGAYAIVAVEETGNNGDYTLEYAVTLEPMLDAGTFDGTETATAGKIVADSTVVKWTACISDDDNFGDGTTGRSHTLCAYRNPDNADWRDTTAFADLSFVGAYTPGPTGDFNGDGTLGADDIDELSQAVRDMSTDTKYDLNSDGKVDDGDRDTWIVDLRKTYTGDANLNGEFNSSDFVEVFLAGKYETGESAGWAEGDWDGNGAFGSSDFVAAFLDGGYELGPRPAVSAVPEPTSLALLVLGGLLALARSRRN